MHVNIRTDGFEGYAKRTLARARELDREIPIREEMSITIDEPPLSGKPSDGKRVTVRGEKGNNREFSCHRYI
jgi:hypothetical protein